MLDQESTDTEALIIEAAKKVFFRKGYDGARLQEIADESGIGRTALHYYFRSKEKLFSTVMKDFFSETERRVTQFDPCEVPIVERMRNFASSYMKSALRNPEFDLFMLNEFNNNPDFIAEVLLKTIPVNMHEHFIVPIEEAVRKGELKGDPHQIFITLLSVCMFPFTGMAMIKKMLKFSDEAYMDLLRQREAFILSFLETAFKA
ncbi:AcrR family transcriptional regulator [Dyadobacter jejuensis]|uniref:AcrR family transcriptional regulator n=1 Tax=Dyadobacter jejuensis TaxID=1082580 RepID=A0A316APW5_9BACT|nr:TetR/AcrR family transcriptional regulator [Dyadobacter jejuensis]PWJ59476.1 AcrR family transcriptional regulator [Dyadobacter jejuensis]